MTDPLPTIWNPDQRIGDMLKGKRGLVVGIANADSIAFGAAAKLCAFGAELAVTWLNDKAEPHVRPLAEQLGAEITMKLDVEAPGGCELFSDQRAGAAQVGPHRAIDQHAAVAHFALEAVAWM